MNRSRIRQSMMEHLESVGWTQGDNDLFIDELPNLWEKLMNEGLLREAMLRGFTYYHFCKIARQKKLFADIGIDVRTE